MRIEINKDRINYLLALYKMSADDLLSLLNEGRKRLLTKDVLQGDSMDLSLLKKIDAIFQKGLNFYCDFSSLKPTASSSVFFRKSQFNTELARESIRVVHEFETLKQTIDSYNKLSRLNVESSVEHCTTDDNPFDVALKAREYFYPGVIKEDRAFLKALIGKCAEQNIFVFEYVETWNKKEKTNMDGFFLKPNMIVLKHQKNYKREIFTLAHELGHFMLDVEEVDQENLMMMEHGEANRIEKWCNDFAFYFMMGEAAKELDAQVDHSDAETDYHYAYVAELSKQEHISRLAIYTRLYVDGKMTYGDYDKVRAGLAEEYRLKQEREKREQENKKSFGRTPKPIVSPLFLRTMQHAYFKGVINETIFCTRLNIKPDQFEKTLWQ